MASIPLPALDIKPPQQPDPMGDVSKLMALRSMMTQQQGAQQELQIRQQQIKDKQATTAAMKDWDGKDYDALSKSVLQNGGSADAAAAIQQHGLTIKKTVSDIAKQDSETGAKNLETFIGKHKTIGDTLEGIEQVPDEQIHAVAVQKVGELATAGILDPQTAQKALQGIQSTQDPKALRQQIDVFAKASMGAKAAAEQAKTEAETKKDTSQATEADVSAANKRAESEFYKAHGAAPGVPVDMIQMTDWLRKNPGKSSSDYVVWKAQHSPTILAQGGFGQSGDPLIDMVGKNQIDLATALQRVQPGAKDTFLRNLSAAYPNYNQGNFGIEKKVGEKYTSGNVADQLMAINTAREHMKTFQRLADALDNGNVQLLNKVGNEIGVEFGSDKATNMRIAAQAFGGEVGRAFDGAGVVASERKQVEEAYKDALSKGQFKGAIQTVDELLAGKQRSAKQSYDSGKQAKPNFGEQGTDKKTDFFSNLGGTKR